MGTFVGHLVPGLALVLIGLWHIINTIRDYYLRGSANFTSSFWYPFKSPFPKLKHLELLFILSFSLLAISLQILDFPFLRLSFKLDNFEHVTMFLHLAIFAGFALVADLTSSSETLPGLTGVLVSSVFGQELLLLHYHSADHVGLEGHYHWLLQLIVIISLVASLAATLSPSNFPAAIVLAISVVFQGSWFINMGFMLWVPEFVPQGCTVQLAGAGGDAMHGAVICATHEAGFRAKALANMQFSWVLAGIMVFTASVCLNFARSFRPRDQSTEYERLHSRGSSDVSVVAITGFKRANPLVGDPFSL